MAKVKRHPEAEQATPTSGRGAGGSGQEPSADRIAARAYELYLARGGSDGQDFDDWLTAERELAPPSSTRPERAE